MPEDRSPYEIHEVAVRVRGNFGTPDSVTRLQVAMQSMARRHGYEVSIGETVVHEVTEALFVKEDFQRVADELYPGGTTASMAFTALQRFCRYNRKPEFRQGIGKVVNPDNELVDYIASDVLRYLHTHERQHVSGMGKKGRSLIDTLISRLDDDSLAPQA